MKLHSCKIDRLPPPKTLSIFSPFSFSQLPKGTFFFFFYFQKTFSSFFASRRYFPLPPLFTSKHTFSILATIVLLHEQHRCWSSSSVAKETKKAFSFQLWMSLFFCSLCISLIEKLLYKYPRFNFPNPFLRSNVYVTAKTIQFLCL